MISAAPLLHSSILSEGPLMAVSFGILSTYPPTQCGLATFTRALATHLDGIGAEVGIVRVVDSVQPDEPLVAHQLVTSQPGAARLAAVGLNAFDVAVVQHEYGIFGGRDGADVLTVLDGVRVPVISVLHTVLTRPTRQQRRVLAGVIKASDVLVTMTHTARSRLLAGWDVAPEKVVVIAHGAVDTRVEGGPHGIHRASGDARPVILTWGLLGMGKGIEWAIQAMADLADVDPRPVYRVVGQTHPRVVEREGEAYREGLLAQVAELGLSDVVEFDNRYLDGPALRAIVRSADVVLLPYDSRDQVTSGVLVEAVVAGKPVVSTRFPHAVELLAGGAGLLVPQRDPDAIRSALHRILTQPALAGEMAETARNLAPGLLWAAVAGEYLAVGQHLLGKRTESVA
jgi:glycosyltransferase involved in cell wall biosynthesis